MTTLASTDNNLNEATIRRSADNMLARLSELEIVPIDEPKVTVSEDGRAARLAFRSGLVHITLDTWTRTVRFSHMGEEWKFTLIWWGDIAPADVSTIRAFFDNAEKAAAEAAESTQ